MSEVEGAIELSGRVEAWRGLAEEVGQELLSERGGGAWGGDAAERPRCPACGGM